MTWASVGRYELLATTPGPNSVTPIHMAALLPDEGAVAATLVGAPQGSRGMGVTGEATQAWSSCHMAKAV